MQSIDPMLDIYNASVFDTHNVGGEDMDSYQGRPTLTIAVALNPLTP
ncbi:hypothetical protein [Vibrio alginolyticus]|nr:hypothetical protein [Vibrio alginolyticus]